MRSMTSGVGAWHDPGRHLGSRALLAHSRPFAETDFGDHGLRICGVVWAEILHGARTVEDASALRHALGAFPRLPIGENTWDALGEALALLRARGLPMPFQDVLLAMVAIENKADLWSYDAHFRSLAQVLPGLVLFDGPNA